jgi:hypothetical protein
MPKGLAPTTRPKRGIQGREQRGGTVAPEILGKPVSAPLLHRRAGLSAAERLDLTLLIAAQHDALSGGFVYCSTTSVIFLSRESLITRDHGHAVPGVLEDVGQHGAQLPHTIAASPPAQMLSGNSAG